MKKQSIIITVILTLITILVVGCSSKETTDTILYDEEPTCTDLMLEQNLTIEELYIKLDELNTYIEMEHELGGTDIPRLTAETQCVHETINILETIEM